MQGYLLNVIRGAREDVIAKVLTRDAYRALYRFYGARHSVIHVGHKIDFEIEHDGIHMPRLRNVVHLMNKYEMDVHKVKVWQTFCLLLDKHLREVHVTGDFYYDLLDLGASMLTKQDAKRLACNLFLCVLQHEGRIYDSPLCSVCNGVLGNEVALSRSFMLACPDCLVDSCLLNLDMVRWSFDMASVANFSDSDVSGIYGVMLSGF